MCPSYDRDQLVLLLQQLIQIPSIAPPGDEAPAPTCWPNTWGIAPTWNSLSRRSARTVRT